MTVDEALETLREHAFYTPRVGYGRHPRVGIRSTPRVGYNQYPLVGYKQGALPIYFTISISFIR